MKNKNDHGIRKLEQKKRRQRKVLLSLGILLSTLIGIQLISSGTPSQANEEATHASVSSSKDDSTSASMLAVSVYKPTWPMTMQRDVFRRNSVPAEPTALTTRPTPQTPAEPDKELLMRDARRSLNLQAIFLGRENIAIINGQQVTVGKAVAGFTVRRIDSDSVEFDREGTCIVLGL